MDSEKSLQDEQEVLITPKEAPIPRKEAPAYLKTKHGVTYSAKTLAKYAVTGGGPTFHKFGRFVLYYPDDLDAWVKSIISPPMRSTSELHSELDKLEW